MAKPVVDTDLCIGCGACEGNCPEVFKVVDDKSTVLGPCGSCDCEAAVNGCPVGAISLA